MHSDDYLQWLATDLLRAREATKLTNLPSLRGDNFELDQGYQVGRLLHEHLLTQAAVAVGRKIGFTNPETWKEFNLDTPIWAHMYKHSVHFADKGRFDLSLTGMTAPRIEPEIVIKLNRPISNGGMSDEELVGSLEWIAIGFEIVDSHFPDWRFTAADAVADFGVHAALVVGTPWRTNSAKSQRIIQQLQELEVVLRKGDEVFAKGVGSNALGSPLLALDHLARVLAAQSWAPSLVSGEIITTGTLTPLPYVQKGERWSVEISGAPLAPLIIDLIR